jgi:hypothetical protein
MPIPGKPKKLNAKIFVFCDCRFEKKCSTNKKRNIVTGKIAKIQTGLL